MLTLKVLVTYLERFDLGVFILLNIAVFVVKLTDLVPENKLSNGRFLWNQCPDAGLNYFFNKTSSGEDYLRR